MPTYRNTKPLLPIPGAVFLLGGITAFIISARITLAYIAHTTREHHGTPVFMGISLIIVFAGALMLCGKQTVTTDREKITKTLKLFGISIFRRSFHYHDILRIETANQTDIRIINIHQKILILDSLPPDQFTPLLDTLTEYTNLSDESISIA